ncbi:MAG: ribonuclease E/G [Gammaproteobacteria bacterium]|nr:ribonuclease G [Gammaproteobacteria bacterium]PCH62898.1 MAG: ribonuclease E/G [Gammaproteobacteria bacterium]
MNNELLINVTPSETRVAYVENGLLQDVFIERSGRKSLVSNIYKGKVVRVLPGMQAAFVEVGLDRTAFLHVSDVAGAPARGYVNGDMEVDSSPEKNSGNSGNNGTAEGDIAALLKEGDEILVQVTKDPIGTKGARLTMHLSVASRFLVYMENMDTIGISQRIEGDEERERLRELVREESDGVGGYIVRTAAEGASAEQLRADMDFLQRLWRSVQRQAKDTAVSNVVHEDLHLVVRTIRDMTWTQVNKIRIDSREAYIAAGEVAKKFIPELLSRIEYYPGERPIFDLYSVEDEIQRALNRRVPLKSGGYLIIEQTEAMVTIDINTGAYVGSRNLEETIYKTNLEAVHTLMRQLRLRNLGGIIIIDFIDMEEEEHKRQVLRALEKAVALDTAKTAITEVSPLGLVEMSRKRTRESLSQLLCESCPSCDGRGTVKTAKTVCYEILRDILREARQYDVKQYLVLAAREVVELFEDEEAASIADLEEFIGKPIRFQTEPLYFRDQFDVVLM